MIDLRIKFIGIKKASSLLRDGAAKVQKAIDERAKRIGLVVVKRARKYSKISPRGNADRGALQRSIQFKITVQGIKIFVPRNSEAGQYAYLQHEKIKGRGRGTIRKGTKAGWKFITRAIDDESKNIEKQYSGAVKVVASD